MKVEVSEPTLECPNPDKWRMFDEMSGEVEVLEFWAQLIKTIKPHLVVETGSFRGISAFYMARAIGQNGFGKLVTFEIEEKLHAETKKIIHRGGFDSIVDCRCESSLAGEFDDGDIDLLLLDSEPTIRVAELDYYWEKLSPRAIVMFHDVSSRPGQWNDLRQRVKELDQLGRLSVVFLPTPRGLAICQKREGRL